MVRREVRQHGHLRHAGRRDRGPAPDDGSGRGLCAELVARWPPHRISPEGRADGPYSRHLAAGWDGSEGERLSRHVGRGCSWSPDSRFVVAGLDERSAAGAPAGIYLIPLDGGERRAMTQPAHPNYDNWPAFSPDGRHLAYVSCHTHCDVRVVDVDDTFAASSKARTLTRTMHFIGWCDLEPRRQVNPVRRRRAR